MRKMNVYLGATLLTLGTSVGLAGLAHAQYTGPSEMAALTTVEQVLKNAKDDQHVVLEGNLLRQLSTKHYVLSDGTGEIEVEIKDKYLPQEPINEKTKVKIRGEIDKSLTGKIELDAKEMLQVIK